LIKFISSFLTNRKFRIAVEGELSSPREIQQRCHNFPSWPLN